MTKSDITTQRITVPDLRQIKPDIKVAGHPVAQRQITMEELAVQMDMEVIPWPTHQELADAATARTSASFVTELTVGQEVKLGHHRGVVASLDGETGTVTWPPPRNCMCRNRPGPEIRLGNSGQWQCAQYAYVTEAEVTRLGAPTGSWHNLTK